MAVSIEQRPLTVSSRRGSPRPSVSVVLRYILITVLAILVFMPFILSFLGTFKTNPEVTAYPPTFLPREWHPENWAQTWSVEISGAGQYVFARWFFNSFWLAVVNMVTQLFFCSLAAYAFARMRFPGKELIFAFIIASMAIPGAVTLIPGYVFFAKLGWINTYWPLIVPKLVVPFGIFMLTQFFKSIPRELEEAAYIDGASRFRTYWNVAMPLSRPSTALRRDAEPCTRGRKPTSDTIGRTVFRSRPSMRGLPFTMRSRTIFFSSLPNAAATVSAGTPSLASEATAASRSSPTRA